MIYDYMILEENISPAKLAYGNLLDHIKYLIRSAITFIYKFFKKTFQAY